jgi:hypothetical protein
MHQEATLSVSFLGLSGLHYPQLVAIEDKAYEKTAYVNLLSKENSDTRMLL